MFHNNRWPDGEMSALMFVARLFGTLTFAALIIE